MPWKWIVAGAILIALVAVVGSFIIAANLGVARPTPAPTSAPTSAPAPTPALPGAAFELSVDNAGPGFAIEAGEWGTCWDGECQGVAYGADFRYANPGCTECEARFSLSVPRDGQYDVWAWWPRGDDRATDTPFTIRYAGGELTVTVNQRDDGNGWHRLGRLPFRAAEPAGITVRGSGSGYANADAVALTPP